MRKCFTILIGFLLLFTLSNQTKAQNGNPVKVSCDIVSSYIWRGGLVDLNPNIQPTLSFNKSGLEIGTWGSSNFNGSYKEIDLYAIYSIKSFSVGVYDYYWAGNWSEKNFFNYKNESTGHIFEGFLKYTAPEAFPISLMASTWFYGDDKYSETEFPNDSSKWGTQRYSTYFELLYPFNLGETDLDVFVGATPMENAYGTGPGVVNMGITGYRTIKITDKFELPVKAQLIINPQAEKVYMVFGLTL